LNGQLGLNLKTSPPSCDPANFNLQSTTIPSKASRPTRIFFHCFKSVVWSLLRSKIDTKSGASPPLRISNNIYSNTHQTLKTTQNPPLAVSLHNTAEPLSISRLSCSTSNPGFRYPPHSLFEHHLGRIYLETTWNPASPLLLTVLQNPHVY
jgi:hypothetical protein